MCHTRFGRRRNHRDQGEQEHCGDHPGRDQLRGLLVGGGVSCGEGLGGCPTMQRAHRPGRSERSSRRHYGPTQPVPLDSAAGSAVTVMRSETAALEGLQRRVRGSLPGREPGARRPHQAAAHRGRRRTADLRLPPGPPRSPTVARSTSSTVYCSGLDAVAAARMSRCGDQSHGFRRRERHRDARCEALGEALETRRPRTRRRWLTACLCRRRCPLCPAAAGCCSRPPAGWYCSCRVR
jgi:hypothetical protein